MKTTLFNKYKIKFQHHLFYGDFESYSQSNLLRLNLNEDKFPYNIYVDSSGVVHAEISDGTTKIQLIALTALVPNQIRHIALTKDENIYTIYIKNKWIINQKSRSLKQ